MPKSTGVPSALSLSPQKQSMDHYVYLIQPNREICQGDCEVTVMKSYLKANLLLIVVLNGHFPLISSFTDLMVATVETRSGGIKTLAKGEIILSENEKT